MERDIENPMDIHEIFFIDLKSVDVGGEEIIRKKLIVPSPSLRAMTFTGSNVVMTLKLGAIRADVAPAQVSGEGGKLGELGMGCI